MTIQKSDGTVVTQTTFDSNITTNALGNNYTTDQEYLETFSLPGAKSTHKGLRIKFSKGEVISQATLDALYLEPTVPGALSPATGTAAGGTVVTITGTNLSETTGVTFAGTAGTSLNVVSDTQVKVTTPAHAAGAVDVVLTTPAGTVTKTGGYTYT